MYTIDRDLYNVHYRQRLMHEYDVQSLPHGSAVEVQV